VLVSCCLAILFFFFFCWDCCRVQPVPVLVMVWFSTAQYFFVGLPEIGKLLLQDFNLLINEFDHTSTRSCKLDEELHAHAYYMYIKWEMLEHILSNRVTEGNQGVPKPLGSILVSRVVSTVGSTLRSEQNVKMKKIIIEIDD
jgi:hypothetical protein